MQLNLKKNLLIFLLIIINYSSFATHIVGGAFDVQWQGGDSYRITLKVLRDCRNGQADFNKPSIRVGVYQKNNNVLYSYYNISFISSKKLEFINPKCAGTTFECTDEGYYSSIVNMPGLNNSRGYYISWERCCRNSIIDNINLPGDASTAFYAEIPPRSFNNSTPKYSNNPVTLLCVGAPFTYNFGYTDADNDVLVYSITDPLNGNLDKDNNNGAPNNPVNFSGPYAPINWSTGFNSKSSIIGNPSLSINAQTGDISVTPNSIGTYVAAIKVEEFRNGVKIGEVRLELQFNVITCASNPAPSINYSDTGNAQLLRTFYEVEIPNTICFDINAKDTSAPGDSLYMKISSPFFSSTFTNQPSVAKQAAGYKKIVNRFCWNTNCELSRVGSVTFTSDVRDNGCPVSKTSKSEIIIKIKPMKTMLPPFLNCIGLLNNKTQLNWIDTNNSPYLKSYRIYRGINDTGYVLLSEVGKIVNFFTDNNSPQNRTINYTYKITSVNDCDSEGVASDYLGTIKSIPVISKTDDLSTNIQSDTIEFTVNENKCFYIKSLDIGDSLSQKITSSLFSNNLVGTLPIVNKINFGTDSVITQFCWTPSCEAYNINYFPVDIEVQDLKCPITNIITKRIWLRILPLPPINATDMLCMTLSDDNKTYVYYGDSTSSKNFAYYLVYRGINNSNFMVIDTIRNKQNRFYLDNNSPNNKTTNYTYFMIGVNNCEISGKPSDSISTFEQIEYIPKQQKLFTVTVDTNENIRISWLPSTEKDFAKYLLYKSNNNGANFSLIKTLENVLDTFFVDKEVNINKQSYCYHLVMYDTCDNMGPTGKIACSILLKGISKYLNHTLDWNKYIGWDNGVDDYQIFRRYISNPYQTLVRIKPNTYIDKDFNTDEGAYYYYINGLEAPPDGTLSRNLAQSKSNEIFLFQQPNVYPPNAFTANNDNLNDDLEIPNSFVKTFNLKIFNRWGEQIFETNNKRDKWKAELNNHSVQNEVYFYIITYSGFDDEFYNKKGNITIIR